jgi:hypothetical protein
MRPGAVFSLRIIDGTIPCTGRRPPLFSDPPRPTRLALTPGTTSAEESHAYCVPAPLGTRRDPESLRQNVAILCGAERVWIFAGAQPLVEARMAIQTMWRDTTVPPIATPRSVTERATRRTDRSRYPPWPSVPTIFDSGSPGRAARTWRGRSRGTGRGPEAQTSFCPAMNSSARDLSARERRALTSMITGCYRFWPSLREKGFFPWKLRISDLRRASRDFARHRSQMPCVVPSPGTPEVGVPVATEVRHQAHRRTATCSFIVPIE